jgi:putative heme iron utilization protein
MIIMMVSRGNHVNRRRTGMSDEQPSAFLSEPEKARIVGHMNEDHADAVMNYLRVYAGVSDADSAWLTDLDRDGMLLGYRRDGQDHSCRIAFQPPLEDRSEIRARLVDMAATARRKLGEA